MAQTIILCHGSEMDFDVFDLARTNDGCAYGRGFYFTNDLDLGRQYSGGGDPYVARITFENPYVVDLDRPYEQRAEARRMFRPNKGARERLLDLGHDCVLVRQDGYIEMVVLDPGMIESFGRRADLSDYAPAPSRR
ncbi:hypothetical protein D3C71_496910 [compost metagenome]